MFLYNKLCGWNQNESNQEKQREEDWYKKIKTDLFGDENITITHVFYEATFMRDFFERDRKLRLNLNENASKYMVSQELDKYNKDDDNRCKNKDIVKIIKKGQTGDSFNEKLVQFLMKKSKNINEGECVNVYINRNLGTNALCDELEGDVLEDSKSETNELKSVSDNVACIAKAMLNAKPDIVVCYEKGELSYLRFLECKYLSDESPYAQVKKALEALGIDLEGNKTANRRLMVVP